MREIQTAEAADGGGAAEGKRGDTGAVRADRGERAVDAGKQEGVTREDTPGEQGESKEAVRAGAVTDCCDEWDHGQDGAGC